MYLCAFGRLYRIASFCIKPYKTNAAYAYRIAMHPDYQETGIGKASNLYLAEKL